MQLRRLGFAALAALAMFGAAPAFGQDAVEPAAPRTVDIAAHVAEASLRFGIPEQWIYVVMRAESAGRIGAVSSAGAMGLMQLMPGTWARQRARFRLGSDPFDPRDNILAGTSYLREMYDSYGAYGMLAAYNATRNGEIAVACFLPKPKPMSQRSHRCCNRTAWQLSSRVRRLCSKCALRGRKAGCSRRELPRPSQRPTRT
jgi:soluble lytic murein transglycosylase-like protein